jgi:hypothetical protein
MATRTITETDCDGCEKKNVPVKTFNLLVGTEPDPAGGSSERVYWSFDLCVACLVGLVNKYVISPVNDEGYGAAMEFAQKIVGQRYREV